MINKKKELIDEKINNIKNKIKIRDILYLLIGTGFLSFGLVTTILGMPLLGIPSLLTSTALGIGLNESRKRTKDTIERYEKEKNHLNRIGREGIDTSKETSNRRINKINNLRKNKKRREKEQQANKFLNESLAILCISAPLAAAVNPIASLVISAAAALAKIMTERVETKETKNINRINNRINNLYNDLDMVRETYIANVEKNKKEKEDKVIPLFKDKPKEEKLTMEYKIEEVEEKEKPIQKVKK